MKAKLFLVVIGLSIQAACSSGPPEPVEPVWGKQPCGHCAMLVSERAPSAQAIRADGARVFFDDVGCLAAWSTREANPPRAIWVRSFTGNGWVDAHSARYATGNTTPMDYGYLPSADGLGWDAVVASAQWKEEQRGEPRP